MILFDLKSVFEILTLWFVIYHILLFFEGTRAILVLRGIIMLIMTFFLASYFRFQVLEWLLTKLFAISVIAILIIFHPEIRHGLARLGQQKLFATPLREEELDHLLEQIGEATESLCKAKVGGLIVLENNDPLNEYVESGVALDARVSADLITTVFTPPSMLHDGGLVIQNGRIAAAGCLFPLTQNYEISRMFGTRHRAAIGLSEETDAIIIVVSEERRDVSVVFQSRLYRDLGKDELSAKVKDFMQPKKKGKS